MSQSLILPMMEQGQIFDTSKMREWLTTQRSLMPTPIIEPHHAILLSKIGGAPWPARGS